MSLANKRPLLIGALLCLVCAAALGAVCRQDFVLWDDPIHIYDNPFFRPVTAAHVWRFWRVPYEHLYIPISYSVYALLALLARLPTPTMMSDGLMTSLNPHVFHTASLLLHLGNVLLVFGLLRRIVQNDWAAGAGALLFGLHPVQVESVAWASELRGLLAGFFCLLALRQYLEYALACRDGLTLAKRRGYYIIALVCFALALLSKPSAVSLPLMAWAFDVWVVRRSWRDSAASLAGWAALGLVFVLLTRAAQSVRPELMTPLWTRLFVAGDALTFYLGKLVWPVGLGMDYGRTPAFVLGHGWGYATWLVPAALGGLVWRALRRFPELAGAMGLFLAALLPTLGLIPFAFQGYSTVADRYLYLALLGPALGLAWILASLPGRLPARGVLAVGSAGAVIFLLWGFGSALQVTTWNSSFALFAQALEVNPRSWAAHYNLALLLDAQGKRAEAADHFREARRFDPEFADNRKKGNW